MPPMPGNFWYSTRCVGVSDEGFKLPVDDFAAADGDHHHVLRPHPRRSRRRWA